MAFVRVDTFDLRVASYVDAFCTMPRGNDCSDLLRHAARKDARQPFDKRHGSTEPALGMGGAAPKREKGKPVTSGDINAMFAQADAQTAL